MAAVTAEGQPAPGTAIESPIGVAAREAAWAEFYNGNMDEGAYDRIEQSLIEAEASQPQGGPLDVERLAESIDAALYDTPHWRNDIVERPAFARILARKVLVRLGDRSTTPAVPPALDVDALAEAMDGALTNPPDRLHNARFVAMRYERILAARLSLEETASGRPPERDGAAT